MLSGTTELPFAVLSAYLCLGQKYDIHELYHESKKRIFQDIPATLDAYDVMPVGPTKYEHMELVQLAHRTGLVMFRPGLAQKPWLWPGFGRPWLSESLGQAIGQSQAKAEDGPGSGHGSVSTNGQNRAPHFTITVSESSNTINHPYTCLYHH